MTRMSTVQWIGEDHDGWMLVGTAIDLILPRFESRAAAKKAMVAAFAANEIETGYSESSHNDGTVTLKGFRVKTDQFLRWAQKLKN